MRNGDSSEFDGYPTLPITLADALVYFAPATALVLAVLLFENWVTHLEFFDNSEFHTPALTVGTLIRETFSDGDHWSSAVLMMISLALLIYILGHLISAASSLLIDRTLVYKAHGYPYEHLLDVAGETADDVGPDGRLVQHNGIDVSKAYWRGLFFWTNCYLALRWLEIFARSRTGGNDLEALANGTAAWMGWGIVGLVLVRQVFVQVYRHRRRQRSGRRASRAEKLATRTYVGICAGLFSVIGNPLNKLLLTHLPFDTDFRMRYRSLFEKRFGMDARKAGSNNYWFSYLFVLQHSSRLAREIAHWQRLYTFSRNVSTALYLGFLYGLSWFLYHNDVIRDWQARGLTRLTVMTFGLFAMSGMLLVYFYYLYVCYYSKTIYRSFVFLAQGMEARQQTKQRKVQVPGQVRRS
jgi:hypothetical protein